LNPDRELLAKVRGGDFTHAGETEAVELVMKHLLQIDPDLKSGPTLDLGCGLGGTADIFRRNGFQNLYGLDIDDAAILYAQEKYPKITFQTGDASELDRFFSPHFFKLIYLFNVLYGFENKDLILEKIDSVSKEGALLVIFDYTGTYEEEDLGKRKMFPLNLPILSDQLLNRGWKIIEMKDLNNEYLRWYDNLIKKLGPHPHLQKKFLSMVEALKKGTLGGAVIFAEKGVGTEGK
jgi:SAM-dependent methyltransferase